MQIRLATYAAIVGVLSFAVRFALNPTGLNYWSRIPWTTDKPPQIKPWVVREKAPVATDEAETKEQVAIAFRYGPGRMGFADVAMETKLNPRLIEGDVNLGIHGASKSSPILVGENILVATDTGVLKMINQKSGAEIWRMRTLESNYGFHSTPAVYGGRVVAGDYAGRIYNLDSKTGELLWVLPIGDAVGASPLIHKGKVYVSVETTQPNGYVAKVNLQTGQIEWLSEWLGEHSHSSPALDERSGMIVVGDNLGFINGIDSASGKIVWRFKTGGAVKGTAAIQNGVAYVGSWDGFVYALETKTGVLRWKSHDGSLVQSSLALMPNGSFGFVNGREGLCKLNLQTGAREACTHEKMIRGVECASPVVSKSMTTKGQYLVWSPCGKSDLCAYDSDTLKVKGRWSFKAPISGEVRLSQGHTYLVTDSGPGLFELSQGKTSAR